MLIWNELSELVLTPEEVLGTFHHILEHGLRPRRLAVYLPSLRLLSSRLSLTDLLTEDDAPHLEGYRIVKNPQYGVLLELNRSKGGSAMSRPLPRNEDPVRYVVTRFLEAAETAPHALAQSLPLHFQGEDASILYTEELLHRLLLQSLTGTERPALVPRVRAPVESMALLSREVASSLPWKKEDPSMSLTLSAHGGGYRLVELGDRGERYQDQTFPNLDAAVQQLFWTVVPFEQGFKGHSYAFNPYVQPK